GIVLPEGIRDPYVYNYFLGVQHELPWKLVVETNYVGNVAHKVFRAENINRHPGSVLPPGSQITDNFGRTWFGNGGFANNIYGNMRNWRNVVNSNYNALQLSVRKQMSRGVLFTVNNTYSHTCTGLCCVSELHLHPTPRQWLHLAQRRNSRQRCRRRRRVYDRLHAAAAG